MELEINAEGKYLQRDDKKKCIATDLFLVRINLEIRQVCAPLRPFFYLYMMKLSIITNYTLQL